VRGGGKFWVRNFCSSVACLTDGSEIDDGPNVYKKSHERTSVSIFVYVQDLVNIY
jgi:hypothetical protein